MHPGARAQLVHAAAGVIGFPIAVLLHEFGHFVVFGAVGFEGLVLRYASVEGTRPASAEPWQIAAAFGAGPAMTLLTVLSCVLLTRALGPSALLLAVALAAPLRSLSAVPVLGQTMAGQELAPWLDESRLATLTNVSETLLLLCGFLFLAGGWWLMVRTVPEDDRRQMLVPVLLGIGVGGPLWLLWIGPWLLP